MILLEQHVFLLLLLNKYVCYYRFVVWRSQASHKVRDVSFLQYMKTTMNANVASPQSWPHLKLCNHIPGKNAIRKFIKRRITLFNDHFISITNYCLIQSLKVQNVERIQLSDKAYYCLNLFTQGCYKRHQSLPPKNLCGRLTFETL